MMPITEEEERLLNEAMDSMDSSNTTTYESTVTIHCTLNDDGSMDIIDNEESEPEHVQEERIKPNPEPVVDEKTARFSGTTWYYYIQNVKLILGGAGGISSWTALQLSRTNIGAIYCYDGDKVEAVNMAGQFYTFKDIGKNKATAVANLCFYYAGRGIVTAFPRNYTSEDEAMDIMICGFDNMAARRIFFDNWLKRVQSKETTEEKAKCLFIDGRLSLDEYQIYAIKGDDVANIMKYKKDCLFDSYQAEHTVCSMKQTSFMACMIACAMTNILVNFVANWQNSVFEKDVPFFTYYRADNLFMKSEL